MSRYRLRVGATSANLGFGFDTCGLLLADYADTVTLTVHPSASGDAPSWLVEPVASGPGLEADAASIPTAPDRNRVVRAAQALLDAIWPEVPAYRYVLRHDVQLPVGGGLGSSAAAAWAGAQLMAAWLRDEGLRVTERQIRAAAAAAEGGHWDNLAPLAVGGLAVGTARPDGVELQRVEAPAVVDAWRLVLVTPALRQSTAAARAILPAQVDRAAVVTQLQALAQGLLAWQQGDLERFGWATAVDCIARPARWRTLGPWADEVKHHWDRAGVPAIWLSGAGPTLAALVADAAEAQRVAGPMADRYPDALVRISRVQQRPAAVERLPEQPDV